MSTELNLRVEVNGDVIETVDELLRALDARDDNVSRAAAHLIRMVGVQAPDILDIENAELDDDDYVGVNAIIDRDEANAS